MAEQNINVAQQDTLENVSSKIDTLDTVADNIYSKVDTEVAAVKTKTDLIGATGDTGGSTTAGTIMGKLNKVISDLTTHMGRWTATRAGYIDTIKSNTDRLTAARATIIDNIGATGNTGGTTSAGTVMAKLNAILSKVNSGVTASIGKFAGWQSQGTYQDGAYYLYIKEYASGGSIASGTVLYSLSNVIFEKNSNTDYAHIYILGRYGSGTIDVLVDGVSVGTLTLKPTSNPTISARIPVGIKISSLQVKATSAITWGTNGIVFIQMGGQNKTCIAYKVS